MHEPDEGCNPCPFQEAGAEVLEAWHRFSLAAGSYQEGKTKKTVYYLDPDRVRLVFEIYEVPAEEKREVYEELVEICKLMNGEL